MLVIADASPLRYLIAIGKQQLLPAIFTEVYAPTAVIAELTAISTPEAVRFIVRAVRRGSLCVTPTWVLSTESRKTSTTESAQH